MEKENNLTSVKEAVVSGINKSRRLKEGILKAEWGEIVGKFAEKSQPEFIKDGVLTLIVEGPIFTHHFNMNKRNIIEAINKYFDAQVVSDLVIKTGQLNENRFEYLDRDFEKKEIKEEYEEHIEEKASDEGKKLIENEDMSESGILKKIEYLKKLAMDREKHLLESGYQKCKCCGMIFKSEDGEEFCKVCIEEKKDRAYRRRGLE